MGECLLAESTNTSTLERIGVSGGFESESSYSRTPFYSRTPPPNKSLSSTISNYSVGHNNFLVDSVASFGSYVLRRGGCRLLLACPHGCEESLGASYRGGRRWLTPGIRPYAWCH
eukprot:COSAG02_NODE_207_length_29119_cov_41.071365_26_plen_115_part_00